MAEGLVTRAAQANQILPDPGRVISIRVEHIKHAAFGGNLQRFGWGNLLPRLPNPAK